MKYLYNFSTPELEVTKKACAFLMNSDEYYNLIGDEQHALHAMYEYCNRMLNEDIKNDN